MDDFETHPAGTAGLVKRLRAYEGEGFETTACYNGLRSEAADRIEQLDAALTRANAATAAAYEVAAREVECGCGAGPCQDTANCAAKDAAAIRALATPDQTAALDKLIAEAEARVWEKAADIARHAVEVTGHRMREAKEKKNKKEERDWQSMLFCAVDIRTALLAASKKGGV